MSEIFHDKSPNSEPSGLEFVERREARGLKSQETGPHPIHFLACALVFEQSNRDLIQVTLWENGSSNTLRQGGCFYDLFLCMATLLPPGAVARSHSGKAHW